MTCFLHPTVVLDHGDSPASLLEIGNSFPHFDRHDNNSTCKSTLANLPNHAGFVSTVMDVSGRTIHSKLISNPSTARLKFFLKPLVLGYKMVNLRYSVNSSSLSWLATIPI